MDFSQGNPLPSGGVTFDGATGDSVVITGTAGNDSVTMTAAQIVLAGYPSIVYGSASAFVFNLGTGEDNLLIDDATLRIDRDNAISGGTAVTISGGGVLDLGGRTVTVNSITVRSGSVINGTALSGACLVQSGSIDASLGGAARLTKDSPGEAVLDGSNSFTGGIVVNAGEVIFATQARSSTVRAWRLGPARPRCLAILFHRWRASHRFPRLARTSRASRVKCGGPCRVRWSDRRFAGERVLGDGHCDGSSRTAFEVEERGDHKFHDHAEPIAGACLES